MADHNSMLFKYVCRISCCCSLWLTVSYGKNCRLLNPSSVSLVKPFLTLAAPAHWFLLTSWSGTSTSKMHIEIKTTQVAGYPLRVSTMYLSTNVPIRLIHKRFTFALPSKASASTAPSFWRPREMVGRQIIFVWKITAFCKQESLEWQCWRVLRSSHQN